MKQQLSTLRNLDRKRRQIAPASGLAGPPKRKGPWAAIPAACGGCAILCPCCACLVPVWCPPLRSESREGRFWQFGGRAEDDVRWERKLADRPLSRQKQAGDPSSAVREGGEKRREGCALRDFCRVTLCHPVAESWPLALGPWAMDDGRWRAEGGRVVFLW